MNTLRYTLISDGSSDRALIPIITWTLKAHLKKTAIEAVWAELRRLRKPPKELHEKIEKIEKAVELYLCDVLFVHRDAERETRQKRLDEIKSAIQNRTQYLHIPVIPIRMQEAWLLIDEAALRQAAGNPSGRERIKLPKVNQLELLSDPKNKLYELLRKASGLSGRRLNQFQVEQCMYRLAELIMNFTMLRNLSAFQALESDIKAKLIDFK